MLSVKVHLHELSLGKSEPELEVKCAPLRVIKDIKKSSNGFLLQLQQVFSEQVILLVIVFDQWLHEKLIVGR